MIRKCFYILCRGVNWSGTPEIRNKQREELLKRPLKNGEKEEDGHEAKRVKNP